jgi:hypothetical protein
MATQPVPHPTLAQVVDELKNLHARLSETRKVTDNLTTPVATVQKTNDNLATYVTVLLAHLGNNATSTKKQQLPTPDRFDGTKWETWESYAWAKLQTDATAIGHSRAQFCYLSMPTPSLPYTIWRPTATLKIFSQPWVHVEPQAQWFMSGRICIASLCRANKPRIGVVQTTHTSSKSTNQLMSNFGRPFIRISRYVRPLSPIGALSVKLVLIETNGNGTVLSSNTTQHNKHTTRPKSSDSNPISEVKPTTADEITPAPGRFASPWPKI